jgi:aerobic-type carbon monoxide dehydrogenase small subunit (CoxS/CutS family)
MREKISARLPLDENLTRGPEITMVLNGKTVKAFTGESVAAVLIAEDLSAMRTTINGEPRGIYCGMGVCFDCLVVVNGIPNTRACMTWATEAMVVSTQVGFKASNQ